MIKLYKQTFFINDFIYTTSSQAGNFVSKNLLDILSSFKSDSDILASYEILSDILRLLPFKKSYIETNSDFNHPLPKDLVKPETILIAKGLYTKGKSTFNLITQIAFKYNNVILRLGVINDE